MDSKLNLLFIFLFIPIKERVTLHSLIVEKDSTHLTLRNSEGLYKVPIEEGTVKTEVYWTTWESYYVKGNCRYITTRDTSFFYVSPGYIGQYLTPTKSDFFVEPPHWESMP